MGVGRMSPCSDAPVCRYTESRVQTNRQHAKGYSDHSRQVGTHVYWCYNLTDAQLLDGGPTIGPISVTHSEEDDFCRGQRTQRVATKLYSHFVAKH